MDIRDQQLLQQLPFLQDLISNTGEAEEAKKKASKSKAKRKVSATPKEMAFNPPCSFWGLVCLLLLLETKISPEELFGDCSTPPSLPSETLQVLPLLRTSASFACTPDDCKFVAEPPPRLLSSCHQGTVPHTQRGVLPSVCCY